MQKKRTVRPVGVGAAALLLALGATTARASAFPSWQDYRTEFLQHHRHYLPNPLRAPTDAVNAAWIRAQGRYFVARERAIGRIRKAYVRALTASSARNHTLQYPSASVAIAAIRPAVMQAFGSEATHALAVLQCENPDLNPRAIHHDGDGTSDWGLFQINIVYNRGAFDTADHLLDPWYNISVAARVYAERGWGDWTCGRLLGLG
jgi:hypothetical protein